MSKPAWHVVQRQRAGATPPEPQANGQDRRPGSRHAAAIFAMGAVILATLIAGCGGAASSTTRQAVKMASLSSPAASAGLGTSPERESNPNDGRDYPRRFEDGFLSSCIETATMTRCVCVLSTLESHVTHATVVAEIRKSEFVSSPGYQFALRKCGLASDAPG